MEIKHHRDETLYKAGYFDAWNEEFIVNPYVEFPQGRIYTFSFGPVLDYFHVNTKGSTLVGTLLPYGTNERLLVGAHGGLLIDTRDNSVAPYKGFYFDLQGQFYPNFSENKYNFGKTSADLRAYLFSPFTDISLALRLRGEKNFGTYPFYKSAFLGGSRSLRGYASERFAGDASLLGSAELRFRLFKMKFLVPITLGMLGFGESGRVFLENETSDLWHTAYGGGLYAYIISRDYTFTLTFARSKEKKTSIYFNTGFAF